MLSTVSINPDIIQEAQLTASKMGLPPDVFLSMAIMEFVKSHNPSLANKKENIDVSTIPTKLPGDIIQAQYDTLEEGDW
jgi:hypothetical protein